MTRDEALKIVDAIPHPTPTHWVDCFVALGMLKLDEPSGESEKLAQTSSERYFVGPADIMKINAEPPQDQQSAFVPLSQYDRVALGPHPDQPNHKDNE